jgi:hypothetical protein
VLEAIEAFGPAVFLRTSFYAYPIINLIHVLAIGTLVTAAALMDLRVLGLGRAVPADTVIRYLRPVAIGALIVAILSGVTMFSVRPSEYFFSDVFRIKLALLALALLNALLFTSFRAHRNQSRIDTKLMALISIGLWVSVAFAGRLIGYTM